MKHKTNRCEIGLRLWSDYVVLPMGARRDMAVALYRDHVAGCRQCQAWKAEQYNKASSAPVYDWDLQEAK